MNYDLIFAIAFYFILYLIFLKYREKFDVQSKVFIMYRAQWGITLMDKIAKKFPKLLKVLGFVSVVTGFLGMAVIFVILLHGTLNLIIVPEAKPVLAPILPGVTVPGAPTLSFWHWIIGILVIAALHEFMHGVYSRLHHIKVKASGIAFLGPILAAFVEPDEKQLQKSSKYKQLTIISAGPFANFLLAALVFLILIFVFNPLGEKLITYEGVMISSIDENLPINQTRLRPGMTIDSINGIPITTVEQFSSELNKYQPGQEIEVKSNGSLVAVALGSYKDEPTKGRLGVGISHARVAVKEEYSWFKPLYPVFGWFLKLTFWLFTISLGVGLFNLLPLGPIDGGRMFMLASLWITKDNQNRAKKIWTTATWLCLILIFINLLPYLIKLLQFIFGPIFVVFAALF